MSATIWKERLPTLPQHRWFEAFEENGLKAVDALLLGRFDLANLAVEEPSVLLTTWVRIIGDRGGFSTLLDDALSAWIDENWAKSDHASIARIRSVWDQLGVVLSATAPPAPNPCPLAKSAAALRARIGDQSGFATTLFAFRGRDAFHTCLNAVALSQRDDELRTLWWRLIELPGGFPIRYASVALNGLRCLRDSTGVFRYDVAYGVFAVGRAFTRKVREGAVDESEAVEEFKYLYRRIRAYYPGFNQEWNDVFGRVASPAHGQDFIDGIWSFIDTERQQLARELRGPSVERRRRPGALAHASVAPRLTWDAREDPKRVVHRIRRRERNAIADAEDLLNRQRDFGRRTGNFSFYAKSVQTFAAEVCDWNTAAARRWAKELVEVEGDDPRAWSLLVNVLKMDEVNRAWRLAWAVVDRFPLDSYTRSGLGEVLKEQGRFAEAEEVYRQGVEDFPRNVVLRGGLAEALRNQGKLVEAEEVCRDAIKGFPLNAYLHCGLAEVLKERGRFGEAEEVYRQAAEVLPTSEFVRAGLAELLKEQGRLTEAEDVYGQAVEDFPSNAVLRNGWARVLALRAITAGNADNAWLAQSRKLYKGVANDRAVDRKNRRFALNGWAWVCERIGDLNEAERIYREVLGLQPNDSYAIGGLERIARQRAGRSETESMEPPSPLEEQAQERVRARDWNETFAEDENRAASDTFAPGVAPTRERHWHPTGYHLRLARAAFFRRSADHQERLPPGAARFSPETLRAAARKMLTEVLDLRPTDARARAELASLDFEEGRTTTLSGEILAEGISELLAVAASAARHEAKRAEAKLGDAEAMQRVLGPALRLRSLGPAGRPLADMAEGLGYLALQNGSERLARAADAFEHLRLWIRPRAIEAEALLTSQAERHSGGNGLNPVLAWSGRVATHFLEKAEVDLTADSPVLPEAAEKIDRHGDKLLPLLEQASLDYAKELSPRIEELFEAAGEV